MWIPLVDVEEDMEAVARNDWINCGGILGI